jgi:hypothetical protein
MAPLQLGIPAGGLGYPTSFGGILAFAVYLWDRE